MLRFTLTQVITAILIQEMNKLSLTFLHEKVLLETSLLMDIKDGKVLPNAYQIRLLCAACKLSKHVLHYRVAVVTGKLRKAGWLLVKEDPDAYISKLIAIHLDNLKEGETSWNGPSLSYA